MESVKRESPFKISSQARLLFDEPLAPITSFNIGGPAELLLIPAETDDIVNGLRYVRERHLPWRALGNGTNILIPDAGLPGLTIKLWHTLNEIAVKGNHLRAQAGADMLTIAMRAGEAGLAGLEWGCGIPGTVGGAVFMNAGVPGCEIKDTLVKAKVISSRGSIEEYSVEQMEFGYRTSRIQTRGGIVVEAEFALEEDSVDAVFERMNAHLNKRRGSQPIHQPNCGSVFRNPVGDFAGRLIEAAGLKGTQVGGVQVSEQHANFIVNMGGGTAEDVMRLVTKIRETVEQRFGVELELELRMIS